MCTAINFKTNDHYFGRTLDFERDFGEKVVITPRNYCFVFKEQNEIKTHYAMIGMARIQNNYPLYFDATNEKGLSVAGLNFPENAFYSEIKVGKSNITPFEFIPWILGRADCVDVAKALLDNINIVNIPFDENTPLTSLHWIISDKEKSITVEPLKSGLKVYENKVGVLTNNPPFDIQMFNLNNYMSLSSKMPENRFSEDIEFDVYSNGLGLLGLPGDFSSASRFVRACFIKENSVCREVETESVSQFFHIMDSIGQIRGVNVKENGEYNLTYYTSCCNTDKCIYYYTTYENRRICAINMYNEDLNKDILATYELMNRQNIKYIN
ncbi:MAG: choloylglycine hydrolase [Clostridia bacterium]|nr:choloylglycine hydrolase [Clostridia bacterium]